jgi:hypothetical protein
MSNARLIGIEEVLTTETVISFGKPLRVFLDGVERRDVIRAQAGMIEVFKRRDGELVHDGHELATECLYGEVRVEVVG